MAVIKRFNLSLDEEYNFYLESLLTQFKLKKKKTPSPQTLLRNLLKETFELNQLKDLHDFQIKNSTNSNFNQNLEPKKIIPKRSKKKVEKKGKNQRIKSQKTIGTQLIPAYDPLAELRKHYEDINR